MPLGNLLVEETLQAQKVYAPIGSTVLSRLGFQLPLLVSYPN